MSLNLIALLYLVASVCFIQALKGLSHPTTSIRGNFFGMVGMTIAVLATAFGPRVTIRLIGREPQETPMVRITDSDGAVGTGYSYLQEFLPQAAAANVRDGR